MNYVIENFFCPYFIINSKFKVLPPYSKKSTDVFGNDFQKKGLQEFLFNENKVNSEEEIDEFKQVIANYFESDNSVLSMSEKVFSTYYYCRTKEGILKPFKIYCLPIKNSKEEIESLILSLEDWSEIISLQESLGQLKEKEKESETIISEVLKNEKEIVGDFLEETFGMLQNCKQNLINAGIDSEKLVSVFRDFHTLKGGSQMVGFAYMGKVVHEEEQRFDAFKKKALAGSNLDKNEINFVLESLSKVSFLLSKYAKQSKRILNIEDSFYLENVKDVHRLNSKIDNSVNGLLVLAKRKDRMSKEWTSSLKRAIEIVRTGNNVSTELENPLVREKIQDLQDCLKMPEKEMLKEESGELSLLIRLNEYLLLSTEHMKTSLVGLNFNFEKEFWKGFIDHFLRLTKIFFELQKTQKNRDQLKDEIENFNKICNHLKIISQRNNLFYFDRYFSEIEKDVIFSDEKLDIILIEERLQKIWGLVELVLARDFSYHFSLNLRKEIYQAIKEKLPEATKIHSYFQELGNKSNILIFIISSLIDEKLLDDSFGSFCQLMKYDSIDDLLKNLISIAPTSEINYFNSFLELFKNSTSFDIVKDKFQDNQDDNYWNSRVLNFFKLATKYECFSKYLIFSELYRLFCSTPAKEEDIKASERMKEVPMDNLNVLKEEIYKISDLKNQKYKKLRFYLDHLYDLPCFYHVAKLKPMVKEIAHSLGKEAEFHIFGGENIVPKKYMTAVASSLLHMVKNSLDHGIEEIEERRSIGKPPVASLSLKIQVLSDKLLVEFEDDGKGIDVKKLKEKAKESGVVKAEVLGKMSQKEVCELIFSPQITTKDSASMISGRGVGMNAVKANIDDIGGILDMENRPGKGLKVIINFPYSNDH